MSSWPDVAETAIGASALVLIVLITCHACAHADEMPAWVMTGILATESRSYVADDGSIVVGDSRRGAHGERGCCQVTYAAWRQVRVTGQRFADLDDPYVCYAVAVAYLAWLHRRQSSWERCVEAYNAGPGHRSPLYLNAVRAAGAQ